jgi:hypothetical protein
MSKYTADNEKDKEDIVQFNQDVVIMIYNIVKDAQDDEMKVLT